MQIDTVCTLIANRGKLGVPVWCYEWITDFFAACDVSWPGEPMDSIPPLLTRGKD